MHWIIERHDWIDSTNDEAVRRALAGAVEGTVVVAEGQRSGRGQYGRVWESPHGSNLYVSLILRPPLLPAAAQPLTLVTAVAVAEIIETVASRHPDIGTSAHRHIGTKIKPPNDILIDGKKCAGILSEATIQGGVLKFVVVGIGVNVNATASDFSPELRAQATSLRDVSGCEWNRAELLDGLLAAFATRYTQFLRDGFESMRAAYATFSAGCR